MGKKTVEIDEAYLELFGTGTLIGAIASDAGRLPSEVELVFIQSSMRWRKDHGGPRSFVVPESAIKCLVEDVLRLGKMGTTVTTSTRFKDEG